MTLYKYRLKLHRMLEKFFGFQAFGLKRHGHRDYADIRRVKQDVSVIFDVGANVGQSAFKFNSAFPLASIHCFEPVTDTFDKLKLNTRSMKNIFCYEIGLGDLKKESTIYLTDASTTNSLIRPDAVLGQEIVKISTMDEIVISNSIGRVDILKIDTEGFDLEVLKGAVKTISSGKVSFILVEMGFHPKDSRHVLFDEVRSFLMPLGYSVFGVYDQQLEWTGESRLRFANVCFANDKAISKV